MKKREKFCTAQNFKIHFPLTSSKNSLYKERE